MSRVVIGQFSASTLPLLRCRPAARLRPTLLTLNDDLQILAGERPLALAFIALLAKRWAAPARRRISQQLKAELPEVTARSAES